MNCNVPTNEVRIKRPLLSRKIIANPDDSTICDKQSTKKPSFTIMSSKIKDLCLFFDDDFRVEEFEFVRFGGLNELFKVTEG